MVWAKMFMINMLQPQPSVIQKGEAYKRQGNGCDWRFSQNKQNKLQEFLC